MINSLLGAGNALLAVSSQFIHQHPKRITAVIAALLLSGGGGAFAVASFAPDASELPVRELLEPVQALPIVVPADLDLQALRLFRSEITRSSDTADTLLKRLGVDDAAAAAFLRSDATARQVLIGRGGRNVTAETSEHNGLLKLSARWNSDTDGKFNRLVLEKTARGFVSRVESAALTATSHLASGTIQSSLFAATDDARIPDNIATQMAEIFAGDIDFHRSLRKGDRFSVVYETLEGDGEPLRTGRVLSAEFVNNGKTFQAMWFQDPALGGAVTASSAGTANTRGKGGYYTLDGQSLRRAFLASPMEFSRVTSGFKMRMHPILKVMRAHQGVDYGAPTGTAVRSVGDGVVDFAGVQNGYGNVIILQHRNNYKTVYAHLSRINVRKGESVSQSQNIGAVGATGWATGPHLHFEYRINGVYTDPQNIARENVTTPLSDSAKPVFARLAAENRVALAAAASMQTGSTQ
ncbi:peptidase M23B [Rhodoferax ferrireducens T118]|uniref:Peptidase M23B n=1 Tax=Albidiferax ferrireducens (strain ATCC BAA-621 / DSM 15236 / T118) TaxID=338969 RepID=Q220S6_ALBFT|nr:peptidase M23B [Rhodoferax ferrireducens T118]